MSMHYFTAIVKIQILSEVVPKETNSLYGTNMKTQFPHIIYTGQSCSCSPEGRNVQAGLAPQRIYQRHESGFLVL
jgi:hypothetical protein